MSGILLNYPILDVTRIKELFYENHGYLHLKELKSYGLKLTDIRKLQEQAIIKRVESGLFHWEGTSEFSYLTDVQSAVPDGVFTLSSALHFYQLIQKAPSICYVAVPIKHGNYMLPNYPKLQLLPMTKQYLEMGLTEVVMEDHTIRIFDLERTLCDCLKYRNRIFEDQIIEAFANYSRMPNKNLDLLWQYGLKMRMKLLLKRYMNKYL